MKEPNCNFLGQYAQPGHLGICLLHENECDGDDCIFMRLLLVVEHK